MVDKPLVARPFLPVNSICTRSRRQRSKGREAQPSTSESRRFIVGWSLQAGRPPPLARSEEPVRRLLFFRLLLALVAFSPPTPPTPPPPPPSRPAAPGRRSAARPACATATPAAADILRRALQGDDGAAAIWRGDANPHRWELRPRDADEHEGQARRRQDLVQELRWAYAALSRQDRCHRQNRNAAHEPRRQPIHFRSTDQR